MEIVMELCVVLSGILLVLLCVCLYDKHLDVLLLKGELRNAVGRNKLEYMHGMQDGYEVALSDMAKHKEEESNDKSN